MDSMKAMRNVAYGILGLFVVFILTGVLFGNISYEATVEVDASVDETWGYLTDPKHMSDYIEGFQSIEQVSGQGMETGSKHRITVIQNDEIYKMVETIQEVIPPSRLAITIENDILINDVSYNFEESNGGTRIRMNASLEGKGWLMKPIFVFMKGYMQSESVTALEKMKEGIEND